MCCQENDKSSPSSHLSLPPAACIFSSTHYYPLSRSACSFSPPSRLTLLHWLFLPFQLRLPNISFSSLALISAALPSCHLCPFLASFLLSSSSSPLPHSSSSERHPLCLLIFLPPSLPPPPTLYTHNLPLSYSVFLLPPLFCFPCVSPSMSSPPCVVIVVRLATAATADSRAVGRGRERGDDDRGVKRGWEDEGTVIRRYGWRGWLLGFLLARF